MAPKSSICWALTGKKWNGAQPIDRVVWRVATLVSSTAESIRVVWRVATLVSSTAESYR